MDTATILVVEDHPNVLKLFEKILCKNGFRVLTARNRDEFHSRFQDREVKAVVLDLHLPQSSGQQLAKEILAANRGVKILLTSGMPQMRELTSLLSEGEVEFLQKPYENKVFVRKIRTLLEQT